MLVKAKWILTLPAVLLFLSGTNAFSKDAYYEVPFSDLTIAEGKLPVSTENSNLGWRLWELKYPRASVEGGEAYVAGQLSYWNFPQELMSNALLVARAEEGKEIQGTLYLPNYSDEAPGIIKFKIASSAATEKAFNSFWQAKKGYYGRLLNERVPGAAWFRHQSRVITELLEGKAAKDTPGARQPVLRDPMSTSDLSDTYELFTGGQALSENLQLDRLLNPTPDGERTVDVNTLTGITVKEIDWAPIIKDMKPETDPLAMYVPADQYAVFFPTFKSMIELTDEADAFGTPALAWLEPRAEDAGTKKKYQAQLCLSMSAISRLLGPSVIASMAFTGSDPFLRMGSDVAVLFEAKNPTLLETHLAGKQAAALKNDSTVEEESGVVEGLAYQGVCNRDRTICSYRARSDNVFIVTNSRAQLGALGRVIAKKEPAMASLPEYTFFRDRYKLGQGKESALLILPDATIRKWCGPAWRIADSRRTRAAAVLAELQALNIEALTADELEKKVVEYEDIWPEVGKLTLTRTGVKSEKYGTLNFLTPISELPIDKVTPSEAEAYRWFRDRYQNAWRAFFDPIAIRFYIDKEEVAVDLSVMPLIAESEYRELIEITEGAAMKEFDGDPHSDILFSYGMSLNVNAGPLREAGNFAVSMVPGIQGNALSWLGQYVVLYGDKDLFWEDLIAAEDWEGFIKENYYRLPVALYVDVSSAMKVTAFLASVRAFIEQTAPGVTMWETRKYKDQPYVKISPSPTTAQEDDIPEKLALYYAVTGRKLIITLSEKVLRNAMKRQATRKRSERRARKLLKGALPWLGENFNFQGDGMLLELLEKVARKEYADQMQLLAWGNIPILNEWKQLYPDRNPIEIHEKVWRKTLSCPGGGEYSWNDEWQTMESTVYGHPGQPGEGPGLLRPPLSELTTANFGLTFENDGLRARIELQRSRRKAQTFLKNVFDMICRSATNHWCVVVPYARRVSARAVFLVEDRFLL